ncbi:MAG: helix-turn-helix transcriptional regulator [Clostridia bacterium]|nr:helix-turn-helix transcriptional regulator [Clostridia bacterium]
MSEINLKEIGLRISERRRQLGYTQEQMAEWMNVSVQMISNLERGNKSIRIENLIKVSSILGISTDYILTGNQGRIDVLDLVEQVEALSVKDYQLVRMIVEYCSDK